MLCVLRVSVITRHTLWRNTPTPCHDSNSPLAHPGADKITLRRISLIFLYALRCWCFCIRPAACSWQMARLIYSQLPEWYAVSNKRPRAGPGGCNSNPVRRNPVQLGSTRLLARLDSARLGSARLGSARLGPVRLGSAQPGPSWLLARPGSSRLGPARLGSARLGSARPNAARLCSAPHSQGGQHLAVPSGPAKTLTETQTA